MNFVRVNELKIGTYYQDNIPRITIDKLEKKGIFIRVIYTSYDSEKKKYTHDITASPGSLFLYYTNFIPKVKKKIMLRDIIN